MKSPENLIIFLLLMTIVSAEPVFIEIEENESVEIRTLTQSNIYPIDRDGFYTLEFETFENDLNECNSEKNEIKKEKDLLSSNLKLKEKEINDLNNKIITFGKDKEIYELKEQNTQIENNYIIWSLGVACFILFFICFIMGFKR